MSDTDDTRAFPKLEVPPAPHTLPDPSELLRLAEDQIDAAITVTAESGSLLESHAPSTIGAPGSWREAPAGWAMTTLGEVCWLNPTKPSRSELPDDAFVSFVPMAAVDGESGTIVDIARRRAGDVRRTHVAFRGGDVLMAKITPSMENGKTAVARDLDDGFGFGSTEFHVLRTLAGVLPDYVFYFVRRAAFRAEAKSYMRGAAGQQRVPAEFLSSAAFPLATHRRAAADRVAPR